MEKRTAHYLVRTVYRGGPYKQKMKKIEQFASTIEEAQQLACALSKKHLFASAVIVDTRSNKPMEFWNNGRKINQ